MPSPIKETFIRLKDSESRNLATVLYKHRKLFASAVRYTGRLNTTNGTSNTAKPLFQALFSVSEY